MSVGARLGPPRRNVNDAHTCDGRTRRACARPRTGYDAQNAMSPYRTRRACARPRTLAGTTESPLHHRHSTPLGNPSILRHRREHRPIHWGRVATAGPLVEAGHRRDRGGGGFQTRNIAPFKLALGPGGVPPPGNETSPISIRGRVAFPTLRPPRLSAGWGPAPWTKRGKRATVVLWSRSGTVGIEAVAASRHATSPLSSWRKIPAVFEGKEHRLGPRRHENRTLDQWHGVLDDLGRRPLLGLRDAVTPSRA